MSVIAYFDELSDHGLISYSSNLFILTANLKASHGNEFCLVIYPKDNIKKDTTLPSVEDGVIQ